MDNESLAFRRRPSVRPSDKRPSIRRPSERRPSIKTPSGHRQASVKPTDRRLSVRRPSVRRPSDHTQSTVRTPSERPPSHRSPASSSSESFSSTYSYDYDDLDEDEELEHGLSTRIKTNIQMEKDGLGLIVIQNGPYLQLTGLVEKSAAARDGRLQAGDVFLKIGHAIVLGWTLRELRQLLQGTPIGTILQIQVYRDFLKLPRRWIAAMNHIPEKNGPEGLSDSSEESSTNSEGTDDDNQETDRRGHSQDATTVQTFCFLHSSQLQWISRDWHFFERKRHTFTVGSDIGCDIMIHKDYRDETDTEGYRHAVGGDSWNAKSDSDVSVQFLRWSVPYWTMPKVNASSSSSSSSLSDIFWLTESAEDRK